jgi:DNA-binding cell septation regulator SpoVG
MADTTHSEPENIEQGAYYLMVAPIAELAEYAEVDIDEAVKMRIAAILEAAPPKMDITARPIEQQGNLYGFASVKIGGVTVDDFKIVGDKDGRLFVGMPSKPDKSSNTGYRNTVRVDKELREDFTKAILGAHYDAVEREQDRAANLKATPDRKPIKEQIAEAAKEAGRGNTALPPKEKGGQKREAERG